MADSKKVRIKVYRVGVNFGWEGEVVSLNGKTLATTAVYCFENAARVAAEAKAQSMGLQVA